MWKVHGGSPPVSYSLGTSPFLTSWSKRNTQLFPHWGNCWAESPGALSTLQTCNSNRRQQHCPTFKRKGGTRDPDDVGGRTSLTLSKKITLVTLPLPYLNWRLVRIFLLNTSDFSGKNTQQSNSVDSCFEVWWLPSPGSGDHSASDGSYCARNRRTAAVSPAWWEHLSFVTPVTEATGLFCLSPSPLICFLPSPWFKAVVFWVWHFPCCFSGITKSLHIPIHIFTSKTGFLSS